MITSTMGRMAEAEKLSIPQLQMAIKDGSLPAYIGIPLLQDKMKQTQQAKMAQAGTQPQQPPVAQQVMQQASQMGIDHLRSNLPTEGMAGGGIIAFEDGGQVIHAVNGLPESMFGDSGDLLSRINDLEASAKIAPKPVVDNTMIPYDQAIARLKAVQNPAGNNTSPYLNPSQAQGVQTALNTNAAADATAADAIAKTNPSRHSESWVNFVNH